MKIFYNNISYQIFRLESTRKKIIWYQYLPIVKSYIYSLKQLTYFYYIKLKLPPELNQTLFFCCDNGNSSKSISFSFGASLQKTALYKRGTTTPAVNGPTQYTQWCSKSPFHKAGAKDLAGFMLPPVYGP